MSGFVLRVPDGERSPEPGRVLSGLIVAGVE